MHMSGILGFLKFWLKDKEHFEKLNIKAAEQSGRGRGHRSSTVTWVSMRSCTNHPSVMQHNPASSLSLVFALSQWCSTSELGVMEQFGVTCMASAV